MESRRNHSSTGCPANGPRGEQSVSTPYEVGAMQSAKKLLRRALFGFVVGVVICVCYWVSGLIPREIWFNSQTGRFLIQGQSWFWPTAILGVVFREEDPRIAIAILYAMNGLTYSAISVALFALRSNTALYLMMSVSILSMLTWFNVSIMQDFSWLGFSVALLGLVSIGFVDLRQKRTKLEFPAT
jgi:hypothetical protein